MTLQTTTFADLFAFTRASTGSRFNSSGVLVSETTDVARFDYDPGASNAARGLLIEGQRTNLLTYSQDLSNAAWSKTNASVALNQTDLFGTSNAATRMTDNGDAGSGAVNVTQGVTISGTNAVFWAVLRAGTITNARLSTTGFTTNVTGNFNLSDGSIRSGSDSSAKIVSLGSSRYLCCITIPVGADPTGSVRISMLNSSGTDTINPRDGSNTLDVLAVQIESGNFATAYIKTEGSQVTRSADVALISGTDFSNWFEAAEGTFYVEFTMLNGARDGRRILEVSDGTNNERLTVAENASAQLVVTVRDGGSDQASMTAHTITNYAAVHKLAFAFKANDCAVSVNGATSVTDTSATIPTVDRMHIGSDYAGANQGQCHIRAIQFYPTRKSNAELEALTA